MREKLSSQLREAVRKGDKAEVIRLISISRISTSREERVNINLKNRFGATALHYAAMNGHTNIVQLLIRRGTRVRRVSMRRGVLMIRRAKIYRGARSDIQDRNGNTALHCAVRSGNVDIVQRLADGGADLNAVNGDGMTALHIAAGSGSIDIVKMFLDNEKTNVNAISERDGTALHWLIEAGIENITVSGVEESYLDLIRELLSRNIDINAKDIDGWTALDSAIDCIRTEKANEDVNEKNIYMYTQVKNILKSAGGQQFNYKDTVSSDVGNIE